MSGRPLPDATVRMLVCGNTDRGDDGVAPVAVATLLPALPPRFRARLDVRRSTELRVEDLADLPADVGCLIVDAVAGVEPGQVVRVPLSELSVQPGFTPRSSHQLPIHLVVGLAGILRERPVAGTFVGLGGDAFGYGTPLSPVARAAIPALRAAIEAEVRALIIGAPRQPAVAPGRGA